MNRVLFARMLAGLLLLAPAPGVRGAPGGATVRLVTLDPGHFHAALVQKSMYPQVDPVVHVYAPEGDDLAEHLKRIDGYNTRAGQPTAWREVVHAGPDFLAKMLADRSGNVLVLAGNNRKKTEYIKAGVDAGYHVLADKPMAIDAAGFEMLREAFATARTKHVLLYDIMTERNEITTALQREFSQVPAVFGELQKGTPENPAVTKESVHHFFKQVSGSALKRPAWYFDTTQQGEGIVDVTTHLVDLVQWECFPGQSLDYTKDIEILSAKRWPTLISTGEFNEVTKLDSVPEYLRPAMQGDVVRVYANGEINYRLRGVCARVSVRWNYRAPEGAGDTHFSIMRGTRCSLIIRQGAEQRYKPMLFVEPAPGVDPESLAGALNSNLGAIQAKYPGVELRRSGNAWQVVVPASYDVGHEAHFAQVMDNFLRYIADGKLPPWEVPNMIAKYYTTTRALELARATADATPR